MMLRRFDFISRTVTSSSSALPASEFNSSDRLRYGLSPGLLERLQWCHLLLNDSDGAQRLLQNMFLIQPHMFRLRPAVCQSVQRRGDIRGRLLLQFSHANCFDDRLCLLIFAHFCVNQKHFLDLELTRRSSL